MNIYCINTTQRSLQTSISVKINSRKAIKNEEKTEKKLLLVSNLNITVRNTELNSQKKAYKRITSYCQHYYFREIAREEKKIIALEV
jgi:hypothetical protein